MNESIQNTRTERKHEKECLLKIFNHPDTKTIQDI